MQKWFITTTLIAGLGTSLAFAETATIISDSPLYQRPSIQSGIILQLIAGTPVDSVGRSGGWKQINLDSGESGWVRSYQVRAGIISVDNDAEAEQGGFFSGLAALSRKASGLFTRSSTGYTLPRTATIGVRGLSEEEINQAQADFKQLEKLERYRSNRKTSQKFAREGQLKAIKLAHLPKSGAEQ